MNASRQAFIEPVPTRADAQRIASGTHTFRWGMTASITLHVVLLVLLVVWKGLSPPVRPPQYRIELIGAAGLKRQMGVVAEKQAEAEAPKPAEAQRAAERPPEVEKKVVPPPPKSKAKPEPKPVKATPNQVKPKAPGAQTPAKTPAKAAAPVAGSGQTKGRGTDVTNMVVEGIQFPFPGYLDNIMRRVLLEFDWKKGGDWVTEVKFSIHRDGSVTDIEILTSSGNRSFDLEGRGAVESAGNKGVFGPLPSGFSNDVLPVYYTFRPADKNLQ